MKIINAKVFTEDCTFEEKDICISKEYISHSSGDDVCIDAAGCIAIPGLTDIHFHGCMGQDFCNGTQEAIQTIADYQLANGITAICPATMTYDEETLTGICRAAAAHVNGQKGADLVGINMEGPFISLAKKGAQNPKYIHKPDIEMFRRLQKEANGLIKLVDLAPEEEGAMDFITALNGEVVLSIAHTTADFDTASEAIRRGVSHITHLYNAMPAFTHRAPGVIGAAVDDPHCEAELICDGIHIHPAVVRTTFKMFGDDRVILISDSMEATGLKDGEYSLGGQAVHVEGNRATLTCDGTIAGSATNLMDCMRTAVQKMGIPLASAVKCAAVNPSKSIGIYDQYGSITVGKYANLVLLDENTLETRKIIFRGKEI
ncbi:N-acetylglucosamine-6-phosphate deacetylase [Diplocloster hominis]|uniref:N-acetylglucosamine-6-phosphate deacetylase n=1 Tax=Diplocloster hominis TaxID=3079010 RepID=UPI0031B9CA91